MQYLVIAVCSLLIHGAATLWWHPYGDLVLAAGALVVHNMDIASLPDRLLAGVLLTVPVPLAMAFLVDRLLKARRLTSA